ncbi:MAG TPA: tetratricopeptide repeat protein [Flavitalea sp.]|nr:tetratricopeptide repeat protein [Flavitalea sp.]
MLKKKYRNKQVASQSAHPVKKTAAQVAPVSKKLKRRLALIIAVFAFILYAQSTKHEYTLDDHKVIDENSVTTKGLPGIPTLLKTDYWYGSGHNELRGPVYRPTSTILFAIAWQVFPNQPHAYHFINVLLFALSCAILFLALTECFKTQGLILPFVCSLLYATHPIHTEVVNNIKSLDEILCFLFGIISLRYLLKFDSSNSKRDLAFASVAFFLSLVSKETGIAFLAILPLTLYFFATNFRRSIKPVAVALMVITAGWLLIRMAVFQDLIRNEVTATSALNNTLYAAPDLISRYATAFYILLRYVGLLFFPHPLTSDYNFAHIKIQTFSDPGAVLGLLVYAAMFIYAILKFRKKDIIAYGILVYLFALAPVSNIFFLGGSSMAERFLYIPSFGFCIVIGCLLVKLTKADQVKPVYQTIPRFFKSSPRLFALLLGICFLYSIKTAARTEDWKDTLTIFSRDIEVSRNSATANELLGNSLLLSVARSSNRQHMLDTFSLAKKYLKRALQIAPGFFYASSNLGYIYLVESKPDSAVLYLKAGLKYGPKDTDLNYYYGSAAYLMKDFDEAIRALNQSIASKPSREDAYLMLGSSYLGRGDANGALSTYYKLIEIDPNNAKAYYNVAGILRTQGEEQKANEMMNKAAALGYRGQ